MCRQRDQLRETAADRAMMHVHFTVEADETARIWRARDIVPFV